MYTDLIELKKATVWKNMFQAIRYNTVTRMAVYIAIESLFLHLHS